MSDDDNVVNLRNGPDALRAFLATTAFGGSFTRPFLGQPWTFTGERGMKPLPSLRYRDLGDMLIETIRAFYANELELTGKLDPEAMDHDALAQNLLRRIEQTE